MLRTLIASPLLALALGVAVVGAACSDTSASHPAPVAPRDPAPAPAQGGDPAPAPAAPADPSAAPADPSAAPAMSQDECTAAGGRVAASRGDGQMTCNSGELQAGRVRFGIEGGWCCKPAAAKP